jgi:MFS family permease
MNLSRASTLRSLLTVPVVVGSLGYFVDIFDLVLFSVVRTPSLKDLGVPPDQLLPVGVRLLNLQMTGLLIGGFLWGMLGDRRGRRSVLFGSILLYSLANLANAFVQDVTWYGILRFVAGLGLAGELGAAITLVAETLPREKRGYGTAIVAGIGLSGAVASGLLVELFTWRVAYGVGGTLGLLLLGLRFGMSESGLFENVARRDDVRRGDLRLLVSRWERFTRFVACVGVAVPIWYVVGILVTFSPELSAALGATGPVVAGRAILWCYAGVALGDVLSGFWSQWRGSRRKVVRDLLAVLTLLVLAFPLLRGAEPVAFYAIFFLMGLATGYWAVFMTLSAENFGTNLRATVTTAVPNLVRGSVVPLSLAFEAGRGSLGSVGSALGVGVVALGLGFLSLWRLEETHSRDLDFEES